MAQIKNKPTKKCQNKGCDNEFKPRKSFDKYCSYDCAVVNINEKEPIKRTRIIRKTPIKKISHKMKKDLAGYQRLKIKFMERPENKMCPVFPKSQYSTTDVHHMKGRVGFADKHARDNNIPLLIDERFWLAVSRRGHKWIEGHPDQAKERGFSKNRLENE